MARASLHKSLCHAKLARMPPWPALLSIFALVSVAGCSQILPPCAESFPAKAVKHTTTVTPSGTATTPAPSTPRIPTAAKEVLIGIDGSGSMIGHARAADQSSWLGLLRSVNLSAQTLGIQARSFRVGGQGSLEVTQKPVFEQLLASPEAPIIP